MKWIGFSSKIENNFSHLLSNTVQLQRLKQPHPSPYLWASLSQSKLHFAWGPCNPFACHTKYSIRHNNMDWIYIYHGFNEANRPISISYIIEFAQNLMALFNLMGFFLKPSEAQATTLRVMQLKKNKSILATWYWH